MRNRNHPHLVVPPYLLVLPAQSPRTLPSASPPTLGMLITCDPVHPTAASAPRPSARKNHRMTHRPPLKRVVVALGETAVDIADLVAQFPAITFTSVGADDLPQAIVEADAALIGWLDPSILRQSTNLRWVQNAGAGVERLIERGGVGEGIVLTNGSGVMAPNMAEHVIGMMLGFARRFPQHTAANAERSWKRDVSMNTVFELGGQTMLLVGLGDIALATAARLKAFGMNVIGVRRSAAGDPPLHVDRVVSIAELNTVLPEADHVFTSVPHTTETVGLFNAERFAAFKPGSYFYNLGRGTSVVQADLVAALQSGHLAGAGLDVTDPEPLGTDDPLWSAPNVFITGHTSGYTPNFRPRVLELFTENVARYQDGRDLLNVVDIDRGY